MDPAVYGPPESAITKEILEGELDGMSVEEVMVYRIMCLVARLSLLFMVFVFSIMIKMYLVFFLYRVYGLIQFGFIV